MQNLVFLLMSQFYNTYKSLKNQIYIYIVPFSLDYFPNEGTLKKLDLITVSNQKQTNQFTSIKVSSLIVICGFSL